ncbi:MAG: hypothetical protein VKO65_02605 [Cyanobacteriota bacterium]|nr:hypothetical protein [Cyanobacteriota bacterium]
MINAAVGSSGPWSGPQTNLALRRPVRISITVSLLVHDALVARSTAEGRSLSNLAAFLLESALTPAPAPGPALGNLAQLGRGRVREPAAGLEP